MHDVGTVARAVASIFSRPYDLSTSSSSIVVTHVSFGLIVSKMYMSVISTTAGPICPFNASFMNNEVANACWTHHHLDRAYDPTWNDPINPADHNRHTTFDIVMLVE